MAIKNATLGGTDWIDGESTIHTDLNDTFNAMSDLQASAFIYGTGSDGASTISVNTTISADKNYTNLTVNAGVTLTVDCSTGPIVIRVSNTLTCNGTIKGEGQTGGAATAGATFDTSGVVLASGAGGKAGGVLFVRAKTIAGSGTIHCNGAAGGNIGGTQGTTGDGTGGDGDGSGGSNGTDGKFFDTAFTNSKGFGGGSGVASPGNTVESTGGVGGTGRTWASAIKGASVPTSKYFKSVCVIARLLS